MNFGVHKARSSALGYSIVFLMLVGLVCSGLLFISSVNKRLELNYNLKEHLVMDNYLSLIYGAKIDDRDSLIIFHPAGDTSKIFIKNWGAFRVVTALTFHHNRRISKTALIGEKLESPLPALYLCDYNAVLKLCGNTKIEGDAYLPERGIERGYLAGRNYENEKLLYGKQLKSESLLPKLNSKYGNLTLESFIKTAKKIEFFSKDSTFRFDKQTSLVSQIGPLYISTKISGNIILHSFDSIYVASTAKLENVILIAPKVGFESGFEGSVQVIAHQQIVCEKGVKLQYPSLLILNETGTENELTNSIKLQEESLVVGGVLITSQINNYKKPPHLEIETNAIVGGIIYNNGETDLRGKVYGNLYTQKFILKLGGSMNSNNLLDAFISSSQLPKEFLYPDWIDNMKFSKSKIITCF